MDDLVNLQRPADDRRIAELFGDIGTVHSNNEYKGYVSPYQMSRYGERGFAVQFDTQYHALDRADRHCGVKRILDGESREPGHGAGFLELIIDSKRCGQVRICDEDAPPGKLVV
ncbi:hypothetical protein O7A70_32985 [Mesorhizobium sp. Cs1299R1N1]|uniref:hypothetical protein n=1 Tax=Mesorhizobium sp. Cs1299R1N1 TaxID=3015172 RepID=UPI00301E2C98